MRMKEWVLLLLTGVLTVGALSVWARNAKKDEDEKEETKIEAETRIDHSAFETEGTYTTRALAEGDVIGGKWIRIIYDATMHIVGFDAKVEGFTPANESGVGFCSSMGYMGGSAASGRAYDFWGDSLEKYECGNYADFYLVEGTHEVEFVSGDETTVATLTITSETKVTGFFGENTGVEYLELIPN